MPLPLTEILALATACAPGAPPQTLIPLVRVESGFDPLAINVNGAPRITVRARSAGEAAAAARRLIAAGRSVDLGLGQINSRNLGWLGLSVEAAFDPCRNLAAAARVLADGYRRAPAGAGEQAALRIALSYYNTGHPERGFANGYVARVLSAAGLPSTPVAPAARPARPVPEPPAWDVFGRTEARGAFVFRPATPIQAAASRPGEDL